MLILFSLPQAGEKEVLSKLVLPAIINKIAMARNGLKSIPALLTLGFFTLAASAGFFIFSPSTTTLCLSVVEVLVATDFFTGAYASVDVVELLVVSGALFLVLTGALAFARSELVVLNPLLLCCDFLRSVVDVVVVDFLVGLSDPGTVETVVSLMTTLPPLGVSVFTAAAAGTIRAMISATAKCNDIKSLFNINLVSTHDYEISKLLWPNATYCPIVSR